MAASPHVARIGAGRHTQGSPIGPVWRRVRWTSTNGGAEVSPEQLLTTGKIAEMLGVSPGKVSKIIKERGIEPDQKKGACGYFGAEKIKEIEAALQG